MPTRVLTVDRLDPQPAALAEAGEVLRRGGLVAFPTETVYGLGANALNGAAVRRVFQAKGRPPNKPPIVHVPDPADAPRGAADRPGGGRRWPRRGGCCAAGGWWPPRPRRCTAWGPTPSTARRCGASSRPRGGRRTTRSSSTSPTPPTCRGWPPTGRTPPAGWPNAS